MPSIWDWLSQIDATPPPSSPVAADYSPSYYQPEQDDLADPSTSSHRAEPRFGVSRPLGSYPRKKLLTSISARRTRGAEIHFAHLGLQLARAKRETCVACLEYRQLRIHELNMMHAIAQDEYNEAALLNEDLTHHQSRIHNFGAMRVMVQEEYQEAITLLQNAEIGLKRAEEGLASMGEQIPPAFSQPSRLGSQAPAGNSSGHSVSSDSHSTITR